MLLTSARCGALCFALGVIGCGTRSPLLEGGTAPSDAGAPDAPAITPPTIPPEQDATPDTEPPPLPPPCESYELAAGTREFQISSNDLDSAVPEALVYQGESYVVVYSGIRAQGENIYSVRFDGDGSILEGEADIAPEIDSQSDVSVVWTGDRFAMAWTGFFEGQYDAWFSILNADREQLVPGTIALDEGTWSRSPRLAWSGDEILASWEGRGFTHIGGTSGADLLGRRIDRNASFVGERAILQSDSSLDHSSPSLVPTEDGVAAVWRARTDDAIEDHAVFFAAFNDDWTARSERRRLNAEPSRATGVGALWDGEAYLVSWYERGPDAQTIWATRVDDAGDVLVPPQRFTDSPRNARYPDTLRTGESTWVVFSDDRDDNAGYELYAEKRGTQLHSVSPAFRITDAPGHSIFPVVSNGAGDEIVIVFQDDRDGIPRLYGTKLTCTE